MRADERIECWDRLLVAVRATLRARGLREVVTPCRVAEIAIEPYIEPITSPPGLLRTSPELAHKSLIAQGARDFFEVAAVFRRGEEGRRHREEFHLLEWYRVADAGDPRELGDGSDPGSEAGRALSDACRDDLEAVVQAAMHALAPYARETSAARRLGPTSGELPAMSAQTGQGPTPQLRWQQLSFAQLFHDTVGISFDGHEGPDELAAALEAVRPAWAAALRIDRAPQLAIADGDLRSDVERLSAWTSLWTLWSDQDLDPWLAANPGGLHLVEFPPALAALAELASSADRSRAGGTDRGTADREGERPRAGITAEGSGGQMHTRATLRCHALRFEAYFGGVELANGYVELRDPVEQRRRFAAVRGLHQAQAVRAGAGAPSGAKSSRAATDTGPRDASRSDRGDWMQQHWPEDFLRTLEQTPLPPCAGVAMGLERLLCVALGRDDLEGLLPADECRPRSPGGDPRDPIPG